MQCKKKLMNIHHCYGRDSTPLSPIPYLYSFFVCFVYLSLPGDGHFRILASIGDVWGWLSGCHKSVLSLLDLGTVSVSCSHFLSLSPSSSRSLTPSLSLFLSHGDPLDSHIKMPPKCQQGNGRHYSQPSPLGSSPLLCRC